MKYFIIIKKCNIAKKPEQINIIADMYFLLSCILKNIYKAEDDNYKYDELQLSFYEHNYNNYYYYASRVINIGYPYGREGKFLEKTLDFM